MDRSAWRRKLDRRDAKLRVRRCLASCWLRHLRIFRSRTSHSWACCLAREGLASGGVNTEERDYPRAGGEDGRERLQAIFNEGPPRASSPLPPDRRDALSIPVVPGQKVERMRKGIRRLPDDSVPYLPPRLDAVPSHIRRYAKCRSARNIALLSRLSERTLSGCRVKRSPCPPCRS